MKEPILVQLSLVDHVGRCEPLETVTADVVPAVDIDTCTFDAIDAGHVAVTVEFSLLLEEPGREEMVGDLAATFRLIYEATGPWTDAQQRQFATTRGVQDAWLTWKAWMEATLAWMGLPPVRLPASAPPELGALAEEAFDDT